MRAVAVRMGSGLVQDRGDGSQPLDWHAAVVAQPDLVGQRRCERDQVCPVGASLYLLDELRAGEQAEEAFGGRG
jgi:hypothetical protein